MQASGRLQRVLGVLVAGALATVLGACGAGDGQGEADVVAGKQIFVEKCGSCHALSRAETRGQTGPNLDEAFRQSLNEGMDEGGVRGVVHQQILYPAKVSVKSPAYMPPKLVEGKQADAVAAYVAQSVAKPGKDTGLLATAVKKAGGGGPAVAKDGVLAIPADPTGQLAYVTNKASAPPGDLKVDSKNDSQVPHNIALEGPGVSDAIGPVIQGGAVSSVDVTVEAGTYQYFCTVPGHREAGMEGELTVK